MVVKESDIYNPCQALRVRYEENFESAIYDRDTGIIHELNPTATLIFKLICEGNKISDIIEKYKTQYNLHYEDSQADVLTMVKKFLKLNIISK